MPEPLLDTRFLERLERLTIQWQNSLPGLVGGHNTSRFAGAGQEFLDHRQFHHGDDLRAVNWRAFLRLEKLALHHLHELQSVGPKFVNVLQNLIKETGRLVKNSHFDPQESQTSDKTRKDKSHG